MPPLLSDPPLTLYVLLAGAALVAGFVWAKVRGRRALAGAGALGGLFLLVLAGDFLVESPREEAVRRTRAMADAANRRDWAGAFSHVSDQFQFKGYTKAAFRAKVEPLATGQTATIHFTAFGRDEVVYQPGGAVKIGFATQVDSPQIPGGRGAVYVEAVFGPDPDGGVRMRSFEVYDFIQRKTVFPVPGL